MQEIIPFKQLGDFTIEDTLNKTISIIKQKGELYKQCDIIIGDSPSEPLYLVIPKEGIKLRFDSHSQRLELIEKIINFSCEFEYSFNKKLVISNKNKDHLYYSAPNYSYINSIFGMSKMPQMINDNKNILLPYNGISFIFKSENKDNNDISNGVVDTESLLYKIIIYGENDIVESLRKDNSKLHQPSPIVRYNGESNEVSLEQFKQEAYAISLGESLEEILHKMKNPNYVYFNKSHNSNNDFECINNSNANYNEDCWLNYFAYGVDILIEGKSNICKRIVLHTNEPQDKKFGIYERCNFIIELSKTFFKKTFDNPKNNTNNINAFTSVTISSVNKKNEDEKNDSIGLIFDSPSTFKIESDCFSYTDEKNDNTFSKKKYVKTQKEGNESKKRNNKKVSFDRSEDKSIGSSFNESNLSVTLNTSELFNDLLIYPWTNFNTVLPAIPQGAYTLYQKHDSTINRVYRYYLFDGIVFQVLDNGAICSVVIYKK